MGRVPELDGLRGIAISGVLLLHASSDVVIGGALGVQLFFVLSGFLITSLLAAERGASGRVSLGAFYARRALRILPPLAAGVTLAWVLARPPVAPTLLFYANFVIDKLGALRHTWTLSIEEQFYLLWPIAFLLAGRARIALLASLVVLAPLARVVALRHGPDFLAWTPCQLDGLALGCLAALLPRPPGWLALPATLAVAGLMLLGNPLDSVFQVVGTSAFIALAALAVSASTVAPVAVLRRGLLQYLGLRSYGIYVYHWPVFYALERTRVHGDLANFFAVAAAKLAISFLVAEASYQTIEALAARWRGRFRQAPAVIRTDGAGRSSPGDPAPSR